MKSLIIIVGLLLSATLAHAADAGYKTITFASLDGLEITADVYAPHSQSAPFIVLFHQAGWSRGEYREIAPKLNALGYNCMAIDQRSGGAINEVRNETHARAEKEGKGMTFLDAIPDLKAAVAYARNHYAKGKLLIWGSSYSAALVLRLGGTFKGTVDGILSFAPGEYFARFGESATFVSEGAKSIKTPVFITSAKHEREKWQAIYDAIPSQSKTSFVPTTDGNHGSRALWETFSDHVAYWDAVKKFLQRHFPAD